MNRDDVQMNRDPIGRKHDPTKATIECNPSGSVSTPPATVIAVIPRNSERELFTTTVRIFIIRNNRH